MPENPSMKPVPVARLVVVREDGRVLILRRAQESTGGGMWCLPGGKIDYGDTVEQAAVRELQEETGLRAGDLRFLFYQDSLPYEPGLMHCINFYFACEAGGHLVLNDESTDSAWIGPDELSRYQVAFRNDEGLRRYWSKSWI
jgi:8-oxo-dGTP diphosphatase